MAGRKVLLVEGSDDEHVLKHICGNRDISHLDEVVPHGGAGELLESIPVWLKASNEEGDSVGVVIDADTDASARWQSIHDLLTEAGYQNVLAAPDPDGTIIEPPANSLLPRAGVWIMPDNQAPGTLGSFLRFLVPQPNALYDHAVVSVRDIPTPRLFSDPDELKAIIHTWLAWQKEPGRPFGTAITAGFLNANAPQAVVLASWLERLFCHG